MGFFSKARNKIKKLIPKEIRPFVPYAAAAFPFAAPAGLGALGAKGAMGSFLRAGLAKGLTDDEADLKDILTTGAIAAAPQAISQGLGSSGDYLINKNIGNLQSTGGLELGKALKSASSSGILNPDVSKFGNLMNSAKTIGAQGAADFGIKAAELNEDALAKYNADLARQGINDKAGRRSAIRAIYSNTGTWDMDEVDNMLDTYGYRTGGRVGYADGGSIITLMDGTKVQIPEGSYNSSGSLKDRIYSSSRGDLLREEIIRGLSFAKGGRVNYKKGGMTSEEYENFQDMLETAQGGLASLEDDEEFLPIRELRLARGGITDINMEEQIDTPSGDMMMDENVEVASNPEVMDSLNELSLMLFRRPLSDLSEDEYNGIN
jgi:hypothetical protein